MIRSVSVFCLAVSALILLPHSGFAQNYVSPNAFNGPNVVIDFGTLDQSSNATNQWAVAPVQQEPLPMVPPVAPRLNPPVPKQQMAIMPLPHASAPTAAPTPSFTQQTNNAPAPRMPAAPVIAAEVPSSVDLPPPADFHARDTLDAARPAALPTPDAEIAKAPVTKTHDMLNQARSTTNDSRDRVNLASISTTPPAAPRAVAPLGVMSNKSTTKPLPMPPQQDLGMLTDDLPPPAKKLTEANDKPMQIASLPPSVSPAKDSASQNFSLKFANASGTLDAAAKAELDKLVKALKDDSAAHAQLRAYASGTPETSGQARRLSLTRALAARTYIQDKDIAATRLTIRALGNSPIEMDKANSKATMDRIDITLVK